MTTYNKERTKMSNESLKRICVQTNVGTRLDKRFHADQTVADVRACLGEMLSVSPDDVDLKETFKISGYTVLLGVKKVE